jgi:hypothetical protein
VPATYSEVFAALARRDVRVVGPGDLETFCSALAARVRGTA